MEAKQKKAQLLLLFMVAFVDYFGLGLVLPLFTFLLFDPNTTMISPDSSEAMRGLWLGVLVGLSPAVMFFTAPIFGTLSDMKGRKKIIVYSLGITFLSYLLAVVAIIYDSLALLIFTRILNGAAAGNLTVVQAGIVDLSLGKEKQKNFGLYTVSLAVGSSIGPLIGGALSQPTLKSWFNYSTPFAFSAILVFVNLLLVIWKMKETHPVPGSHKFSWNAGFLHLKKAFQIKELRLLFLVMFLFFFGWNFFSKFFSVLLLTHFHFDQVDIGTYLAFKGMLFALCAGIFIRPIIKHFSPQRILEMAMVLGGIYFFFFLAVKESWVIYLYHIPLIYLISLIFPVASTIVSNDTSAEAQGEVLGIYGSIQSLALVLSPFGAGTLVTHHPYTTIFIAGTALLLAGIILSLYRLATPKNEPKPLA